MGESKTMNDDLLHQKDDTNTEPHASFFLHKVSVFADLHR